VSADKHYLERRHNTWHVVVEVPKALRTRARRKRFKKSLGTSSLAEANRHKLRIVDEFKRQIDALRRRPSADADAALFQEALEHRKALEGASRHLPEVAPDYVFTDHEHMLDLIRERANAVYEERGEETSERYFQAATGKATFIEPLSVAWFAEREGSIRASSHGQQRADIKSYLAWAGQHATIEETTRRKAGEYVALLRSPASGIAIGTARKQVSTLRTFWRWLIERGHTENNPWGDHSWPKERKQRKGLSDDALVKLLTGTPDPRSSYRHVIHDLIKLALVTGARREELCGLRCEDVERRKDGWWLHIREYDGHRLKSDAATRQVPLHESAVHIIERRRRRGERFLFPNLTPGGPDHRRGWNVGRSFSSYRKRVGVKGRNEVFHALRNTCTERLEAAEVPESTVKLLVGHARQSLTYGHYSSGAGVDLRKAMARLKYSEEVARLIAQQGTGEQ
jgi:integrase